MCGIAGALESGGLPRDWETLLGHMTNELFDRGPDDTGVWGDVDAGVMLGHRRLSVVDLSCLGHQPMASESARYQVVYNGEIYNFKELREQLAGIGSRFRGTSDTEVLLAGFDQWGIVATVRQLVGMFAFAVWDRDTSTLTLGRDRFGEKPLYAGWQGKRFLFGSDLRPILRRVEMPMRIDRGALALYLRHGYVPGPYSIYEGISKVRPGELWSVTPHSPGVIERATYWTVSDTITSAIANPFVGTYNEAVDGLEMRLRKAVAQEMISDVPLGAFLSGGIDSSMIVALMQAESSRPVKTFTIGYTEQEYNEAAHARRVAEHLGTDHVEFHVQPSDALSIIPSLPRIFSEPFADASQIPTTLVSQLARAHVTVALSGDAGDELFGGYNRYHWVSMIWSKLRWLPSAPRSALADIMHAITVDQWNSVFSTINPLVPLRYRLALPGDKLHKLAGILPARSQLDLFLNLTSVWPDPTAVVLGSSEPPTLLRTLEPPAGLTDFTSVMMMLDTVSYMTDDILVKVDRAAMSVGLETRAPFLDHRVFEYAWSLPTNYKVRGGVGKRIVRDLLARYIPKSLFERPKMGFGVPLEHWLRGPLRGWAEALLSPDRLRADGYFDVSRVRTTWQEHLSGQRNWQYRLWIILMFQAWLDSQRALRNATS